MQHTCAGNESKGIVSGLHVLPEVDVLVIEDVAVQVEVVEALGGENHAHIVTAIHHRQHLEEEGGVCHLKKRGGGERRLSEYSLLESHHGSIPKMGLYHVSAAN